MWSVSPAAVTQSGSLGLTATPVAGATDYIYTTAYYAKGSTWLPVTLTGNNAAPSYSSGPAQGSLTPAILSTLPIGTNYVVLWDWLWDATAGCYKGPGLNQCNTGVWRIQNFTISNAPTPTPSLTPTPTLTPTPSPSGGVYGMNIPSSHPRLWFNQARLAQAKTWWSSHAYTPPSWDHVGQAFRHLMTGNAGDCTNAISWAMGDSIPSTGAASDPARNDGEQLMLVFDWCHDVFTASQLSQFIAQTNNWVLYWPKQSWGGIGMENSNYYWGYWRDELEWGITSYYENTTAATAALNDAMGTHWTNSFLPVADSSGQSYTTNTDTRGDYGLAGLEGTHYGLYHTAYMAPVAAAAAFDGRDLWKESNYLRGGIYYYIYTTAMAPTASVSFGYSNSVAEPFPFNDDGNFQYGNVLLFYSGQQDGIADYMLLAAEHWPNVPTGQYARQWVNTQGIEGGHGVTSGQYSEAESYIQAIDPGGTARSFSNLPLDYYAAGQRYLFTKNAWSPAGTSILLQLGDLSHIGHFHYDYGNWQIWKNGRWLSRETVGYNQTITGYNGGPGEDTSMTVAHNTILFNGIGLAQVSQGPDAPGIVDGPTVVNRLESQTGYSYADVDLSQAYRNTFDTNHPDRDNPAVNHAEREFVFVRGLETMVVLDRLKSNAVGSTPANNIVKTFLAHFEANPTIEDARHVRYTSGNEVLRMTTLVPSAPSYHVVNEGDAPTGQYRLEVNDSGSAQSYFLTVLQSKDSSVPDLSPSVVDSAPGNPTTGTFTLTLDSTHTVTFNKGLTSSGGSIAINGTTTNFRSNVQGMSISDNGPAWNP